MNSIIDAADKIMTAIDVDMKAGWVPARVASFSELHDHVDANEYALGAAPFDGPACVCVRTASDPACYCPQAAAWMVYMELLNAIESEVNRRLRLRALSRRHSAPVAA